MLAGAKKIRADNDAGCTPLYATVVCLANVRRSNLHMSGLDNGEFPGKPMGKRLRHLL